MKRSGFKSAWTPRPAKQVECFARPREPAPAARTAGVLVLMLPKDVPVEDAAYRRRVASLACAHCGIVGYSQCAHGPALGRGIKCSDLDTFPLCCDRPGVVGCHTRFDRYRLFDRHTRVAKAAQWAADTRKILLDDTTSCG